MIYLVAKYNIEEDADIKELQNKLSEQAEERMMADFEDIQLSPKFEELLESRLADLPECNLVGVKPDGEDTYEMLPFSYFLYVYRAYKFINMYEMRFLEDNNKLERRAILKSGDTVGYELIMAKQ
jgi:hypothetical protein